MSGVVHNDCDDCAPEFLNPTFGPKTIASTFPFAATLLPLDLQTIEESVRKTGRCLVAHEAPRTSGFGSELVAQVQERCFYHLEAPVERVTGWDTPYPHAYEWAYFPGPKRMKKALEKVMAD